MKGKILLWLMAFTAVSAIELPSFAAQNWLNTATAPAKGKSTLVFVFTRDCGNCHRSHTFMNTMQNRYGTKVNFIGVHSPEFSWEKDTEKLKAYTARMGIRYPVYRDDDMKVWNALDNRYWPAVFLFDARGNHVETFVGETHAGDANAQRLEAALSRQ